MRGPKHEPGNSTPESEQPERPGEERDPARAGASGPAGATALVEQLTTAFAEQLRRALGVELDPGLGTTALAYVDHYLSLLREDPEGETREPIVSLVAANAGAWFGELIRREIGGTWIGDGKDPRRLRLLLEPAFVHFSPIDMAYEAILSEAVEPGDPRIPEGATLDSAFHLRKQPAQDHPDEPSDHDWIGDRLAEVPPVAEDQFFSLTGRFETLGLILALIASREHERGHEPTRYHLNDYIAELSEA
jgi:hypothetical protein